MTPNREDAKTRGQKTLRAIEKLVKKEKAARGIMLANENTQQPAQKERKSTWKWITIILAVMTGYYLFSI